MQTANALSALFKDPEVEAARTKTVKDLGQACQEILKSMAPRLDFEMLKKPFENELKQNHDLVLRAIEEFKEKSSSRPPSPSLSTDKKDAQNPAGEGSRKKS